MRAVCITCSTAICDGLIARELNLWVRYSRDRSILIGVPREADLGDARTAASTMVVQSIERQGSRNTVITFHWDMLRGSQLLSGGSLSLKRNLKVASCSALFTALLIEEVNTLVHPNPSEDHCFNSFFFNSFEDFNLFFWLEWPWVRAQSFVFELVLVAVKCSVLLCYVSWVYRICSPWKWEV